MKNAQIYPFHSTDELQYDNVLYEIGQYCLSTITREKVKLISPITHLPSIHKFLKQTEECMEAITSDENIGIAELEDIEPLLPRLQIKDYILSGEELLSIIRLLRCRKAVQAFLNQKEWAEKYPRLSQLLDGPFPPDELLIFIDEIYDEKGELKENASPELVRIHRSINRKQGDIAGQFKSVLKKYREMGYLHDTEESIRNGRRVLCINAAHKRKIEGIYHDESTSGKTIFIEPSEIIPSNNDLFRLYKEREKEKKRLLKLTTQKVAEIADDLPIYQNLMTWYELIYAKARYALSINGEIPNVVNKPMLDIRNGKHPILYLKNKGSNKKTIPFSLELNEEDRVLLVSGPNAGGKSILLKAVGLMQLMIQSGIPVPVHENSTFGLFYKFFIDIGDHQSVEDDLSTYSSHLKYMKNALRRADKRSMILYDEFGSGTDPHLGGAIAEAVLGLLMKRKVMGMVTSHYGNLKTFASSHKHILNGALLFNDRVLKPTYQLKIGEPGSSYAFEISKNIGLPKHIIRSARKLAGTELSNVEDLLGSLQKEKQIIAEKTAELKAREKQLDNLRKTYDHLQSELEVRRKRMKMEAKENALQYLLKQEHEINELINAIKEERSLEKAEKLKTQLKHKQTTAIKQINKLEEEVLKSDDSSAQIVEGSRVKMRRGDGLEGIVEKIHGKIAQVIIGNMRMEVRLKDLRAVRNTIETNKQSTHILINKEKNVKSKIDIRGLSKKDAGDLLENFLDKALIADLPTVEIIHGKGTGVLRNLTKEISKQYKDITEILHPPAEEGGIGKTIIHLG